MQQTELYLLQHLRMAKMLSDGMTTCVQKFVHVAVQACEHLRVNDRMPCGEQ